LNPADRVLWAWLCSVWKGWQSGVFIIKAATVVGWHRKGFGLFWNWKIRELIRTMSRENPLWGAPHIHGELLKLGVDVGETSVGKYMVSHRKPPRNVQKLERDENNADGGCSLEWRGSVERWAFSIRSDSW
jgi:hypothetical protein